MITVGPLRALAVTLLLEVPFVGLCYRQQWRRLVGVALLANAFTNLTLNVVLRGITFLRSDYVIVGEAFAVLFEAGAYALVAQPRDLGKALVVSAAANAMSYECGAVASRILFG